MVSYTELLEKRDDYGCKIITIEADYKESGKFLWQCKCGTPMATIYKTFASYEGKCGKCRNGPPKKRQGPTSIYSYDIIKKIYEDNACELLTTQENFPEGSPTKVKLEWKCKCGEIYNSSFGSFKTYKRCKTCAWKENGTGVSYKEFCKLLEKEGWEMLDPEEKYKGTKTKMKVRSNLGEILEKSYNNFSQGHRSKLEADLFKKKSFDEVKRTFEDKGFTLLSETYQNKSSKLAFICKCGKEKEMSYENAQKNTAGCDDCAQQFRFQKNREDWEINMRRRFKSLNANNLRDYMSPSGKIIKVSGYEKYCLDDLFAKENIREEDVITDSDDIPIFRYQTEDGKHHVYFPDIYIISLQKFIEVKSAITIAEKRNEINHLKWKSVSDNGFLLEVRIYKTHQLQKQITYLPHCVNPEEKIFNTEKQTKRAKPNIVPEKKWTIPEDNENYKVEIEGYPEYFITCDGKVIGVNGKPLSTFDFPEGTKVRLNKRLDGKTKQDGFRVDELVLRHFLPKEDVSKLDDFRYKIIHLDGNNTNNNIENLAVVLNRDIAKDRPIANLDGFSVLQYSSDGKLLAEYDNVYEAYRETGISQDSIKRDCKLDEKGGRRRISKFIFKYNYEKRSKIIHPNLTSSSSSTIVEDQPRYRIIEPFSSYKIMETGEIRNISTNQKINAFVDQSYYKVHLLNDQKNTKTKEIVHNLVARAFLPPPPTKNHIVFHKNGNKLDNHFENLEWRKRENGKSRKVAQLDSNGNIIKIYSTIQEAALESGAHENAIPMACNGERVSAGSYRWKWIN